MTATDVTHAANVTKARRILAGGAVAGALALGSVFAAAPAAALPIPALPIPVADGNGSLGATTPPEPPVGTGNEYLVGARASYYDNLTRMVGAYPMYEAELTALQKIPVAQWVGGGQLDRITEVLNLGQQRNAIPVAVLYNIPHRDADGQQSPGGAASTAAYKTWIDGVSNRIGDKRIVLILEPDALPDLGSDKLSPSERSERIAQISYAIKKLAGNANARTYVDVGNTGYGKTGPMGQALRDLKADGAVAQGISVNTSNFERTQAITDYGNSVLAAWGHPESKIMVDVSRNGANPGPGPGDWCNPIAQRLGTMNNLSFDADAHVEQMFIKTPGESDGDCGYAPGTSAGQFVDPLLLLQLGVGNLPQSQ